MRSSRSGFDFAGHRGPVLEFCTRSREHSVTIALNLAAHGKSFSSALLELDLPLDTVEAAATRPAINPAGDSRPAKAERHHAG